MNIMLKNLTIAAIICMIPLSPKAEEVLRTWTSASGSNVSATYASFQNKTVSLTTENGRVIQVPLNKLSGKDQLYVLKQTGPLRVWQAGSNKVEAYLVNYSNGLLTLYKPDGQYISCKDTRLCDADRKYLDSCRSLREKICCRWQGVHVDGEDVYHHNLIIKENSHSKKLVATDTISLGLSNAQVSQGKSLKRDNLMYPFSMIVQQEYSVTLEDTKVTLIPAAKKARRHFEAPGCRERKWMPPTMKGEISDGIVMSGIATFTPKITRESGPFFLATDNAFREKLPLKIGQGKTVSMTCLYDKRYHYKVYLPSNYDPTKSYPVLINDSPGANANPLSTKMAEELDWIMVGLAEASNETHFTTSEENCAAVIFDIQKCFNVDTTKLYFSGLSGGARRSSLRGISYPDNCAGIYCVGAGYSIWRDESKPRFGHRRIPPAHIPIFFCAGETDMNKSEVMEDIPPLIQKSRRKHKTTIHPGGHTWAPKSFDEEALQWLNDQS